MKKKILVFIFLSMAFNLDAKIKHIFIDINLLVETSTSAARNEVGTWNGAKYLAHMGKIPCKADFFKSLKNCSANSDQYTYNEDLTMPLVLSDWLLGTQSNNVIKNTIFKYLENSSLSDIEKTIFKNISNMMLTPTTFINTQFLRKDIVKTLHHLHKHATQSIHLIGNWDKESEPLLIKMIVNQTDLNAKHCIFSNKLKQIKPQSDYFDELVAHCKFDPKECLVIDVEKKHIQGAKNAGMASILIKNHSSSQLKTELSRFNILH